MNFTDVQIDAYQESADEGRKFADVYYDDNRFTLRAVVGFRF